MNKTATTFTALTARLAAFCLTASALAAETDFPPPKSLGDTANYGRNIQRTMRLLAESTPEKRNTVRVLFYGQSITEQKWSELVADDLRRRFPNANLVIENRALAGFASQMLVRTAETDLYSFQPDLLIFHVYGPHDKYEDIIHRTRERTCAEILMQTDHVVKPADLTEETDPAKVPIQSGKWDAFMNHNWLPSLAKKYGEELCDQRAIWKTYLGDYGLEPKALLRDAVHLNPHGEYLMAQCVNAYLRRDAKFDPSPAEQLVRTLAVGKDIAWKNGKLAVEFEGTRVDVVVKAGTAGPAPVTIDGRTPSEIAELYGFTRAVTKPEGKWPVKWPVIAPEDWNVAYAMSLAGIKPVPERFTVKWNVVANFNDTFLSPGIKDSTIETTVVLASGLSNAKHALEITGSPDTPIAALRIYQPRSGGSRLENVKG